jgi:CelD/BcsL family acetyltransferase involved in cellulose biosynthesis
VARAGVSLASTGDRPRRAADAAAPAGVQPSSGEWRGLGDTAASDNVFFTAEFALAAIRNLGARAVAIASARAADGRLIAAAPCEAVRLGRLAPAVRYWSHDYAPLGAPLLDRAVPGGAAEALIKAAGDGRAVIVPDTPLAGVAAAAFKAAAEDAGRPVAVLGRHERAIVTRAAGAAGAGLTRRRRKEFARLRRRLGEQGQLNLDSATGDKTVATALEEFLDLEARGWKGRRGSALRSRPETAAMAREAVNGLARRGRARIDSLRLDGRPVAMLVTLVGGATAFTWKIAYDEAFGRYSPGALLMLDAVAAIFADKRILRIDSCATADHPLVDRLWPERMAVGTLAIGPVGGGLLYSLGLRAAEAERAARAIARKWRDRGPL